MRQSNSKGVDLGPAQERVIQAAKVMIAAPIGGERLAAWPEFEDAVKQLKVLEDSIGGHQPAANPPAALAATPDHTLFARAITSRAIRWEILCDGPSGEICCNGLRYLATLDECGVPQLNELTRAAIVEAEGRL